MLALCTGSDLLVVIIILNFTIYIAVPGRCAIPVPRYPISICKILPINHNNMAILHTQNSKSQNLKIRTKRSLFKIEEIYKSL